MELTSIVLLPYLVVMLAAINGFPVQNNENLPISCIRWKETDMRLCLDSEGNLRIYEYDMPISCLRWKETDILLCLDVGGNIRIEEFHSSDSVSPLLSEELSEDFPILPERTRGTSELIPLNLKGILGGPNYQRQLHSATGMNGKPHYVVKKPFDSITYNHDLAGFK